MIYWSHTNRVGVVLHGGLGNQLFQLIAAVSKAQCLSATKVELYVDFLSNYVTQRDFALAPLVAVQGLPVCQLAPMPILARVRFPKILAKVTRKDRILQLPFTGNLIDGYFQSSSDFPASELLRIQRILFAWRKSLKLQDRITSVSRDRLLHLRLGDFFKRSDMALTFAIDRIRKFAGSLDIVTDSESIVLTAIHILGRDRELHVVPSHGLTSWEVLYLMSRYSKIITNGSTLAFWAALLSSSFLETSDIRHQELMSLWKKIS